MAWAGGEPLSNAYLPAPGQLIAHLFREHRSPEFPGSTFTEHVRSVLREHGLDETLQHESFKLTIGVEPAPRLHAGAGIEGASGRHRRAGEISGPRSRWLGRRQRKGLSAGRGRTQARKPLRGNPILIGVGCACNVKDDI